MTQSANGGNAVAAKTAAFQYDREGEFLGVGRYQNADATAHLVAQAAYGYNAAGQLTSLAYTDHFAATLNGYSWSFDALANMASTTNTFDGTTDYTSDSTGQLTDATGGAAPTESYSFDSNGNRNSTGIVVGANNQVLFDGTYTYSFDAEGNTTARWIASTTSPLETEPGTGDTDITIYTWDNRNRLAAMAHYQNFGDAPDQTVTFAYDAFNRWVGETVSVTSGGTTTTHSTSFAYYGNEIVLQFDGSWGSGVVAASNLRIVTFGARPPTNS